MAIQVDCKICDKRVGPTHLERLMHLASCHPWSLLELDSVRELLEDVWARAERAGNQSADFLIRSLTREKE